MNRTPHDLVRDGVPDPLIHRGHTDRDVVEEEKARTAQITEQLPLIFGEQKDTRG